MYKELKQRRRVYIYVRTCKTKKAVCSLLDYYTHQRKGAKAANASCFATVTRELMACRPTVHKVIESVLHPSYIRPWFAAASSPRSQRHVLMCSMDRSALRLPIRVVWRTCSRPKYLETGSGRNCSNPTPTANRADDAAGNASGPDCLREGAKSYAKRFALPVGRCHVCVLSVNLPLVPLVPKRSCLLKCARPAALLRR